MTVFINLPYLSAGYSSCHIILSGLIRYCNYDIILSGWILQQDDASDLERQTLYEWARSRLQQSIREK